MSEEVVTTDNITLLDPQLITELSEFRVCAVEEFVRIYGKHLDKIFSKLTESIAKNEEKSKKFQEIREKHVKQYEKYMEECIDKQTKQLLADKSIADNLDYISNNFDKLPEDIISVQNAINPIKRQYLEELKTFEQKVDQRLETKQQMLAEITENLTKSKKSYESLQTSVQKKVLTIIKNIDSIAIQDLELNPMTD